MRIFLVRHPPILANVGVCYGRMELQVDSSTTATTAEAVAAEISPGIVELATIYSSPLSRCMSLARELVAPRQPTVSNNLLEINFGSWEGRRWDDLPREQIDAWAQDVWNYRPGGGESAEMVASRWRRWVVQIREEGCQTAIAITHAGFIRTALACVAGSPTWLTSNAPVAFGSVHQIDLSSIP